MELIRGVRLGASGSNSRVVSAEAKLAMFTDENVKAILDEAKERIGETGRLVVRPSGTEPLVRIMAEGEDEELIRENCRAYKNALEENFGKGVFVRALIEISSYCKNNCRYCGLRASNPRFRFRCSRISQQLQKRRWRTFHKIVRKLCKKT